MAQFVTLVWGAAMIGNLIVAIRLCYAIEARSGVKNGPQYANLFPVALNIGVARDAETQRLRRKMNLHLLFVPIGFAPLIVFALYMEGMI
ncbi:hypothetical protein W911_08785 [Hyphomicrobium nitrativorans NL23]|uniref:Uncharacterized protein n=1 Tax=Hyphomicrobium nitrativorans NL23 TaxID=1029756 RepID=V5SEJ2_9HYPH|nr:hypothetical protein [Hyphomicrobium nitrativorans]AHB48470.1 hypothetical protein W911_08785 [Hyphomicrobium nitrativorans NL23]